MKDLVEMTYKELEDLESDSDIHVVQDAQKEMYRRNKLFRTIAKYLKIDYDSIIDESLEYIAKGSLEDVIRLIEQEEAQNLREYASITAFQTIRRSEKGTFHSERSIREVCGLNTRDAEASNALKEIKNFIDPISVSIFRDPVVCNNGQTLERKSAERILRVAQAKGTPALCPLTRQVITSFVPNIFAKQTISEFVEKYEKQKGGDWKGITDLCKEFRTEDTEEHDVAPVALVRPLNPRTYNIQLVGATGVGKTSFIERLLTNTFNPVYRPGHLQATVVVPMSIGRTAFNISECVYTISQPNLAGVVAAEWANTDVFFVMFSLTIRLSFIECDRWIQTIRQLRRGVPIVLIGLKSDASNQVVLTPQIDRLRLLYNIPYVSISSRTSTNLHAPFLAVQDILD